MNKNFEKLISAEIIFNSLMCWNLYRRTWNNLLQLMSSYRFTNLPSIRFYMLNHCKYAKLGLITLRFLLLTNSQIDIS